jgi:hypothetical protein
MFIELVDVLRCSRPHEESWLVAVAKRMDGRDIADGVLGCPICGAEYPIVDRLALFDADAPATSEADVVEVADGALRLAAYLDLAESAGLVILAGGWARYADELANLAQAQLLLLNPPPGVRLGGGVSGIRAGDAIPVAAASSRGIALDRAHASRRFGTAASRALRTAGRLVAPLLLPAPAGIGELARDARWWVGEREAVGSAPVKLEIARG